MPRYMQTAAKANQFAKKLLALVPADKQAEAAAYIAQLVNLGIRCAPRAVQSTVRYNSVREAVRDLPVKVSMLKKTDPRTHRTYNALQVSVANLTIDEGDDDSGDSEE